MIRINQLCLTPDQSLAEDKYLPQMVAKALKIPLEQVASWQIVKKALDARKKQQLHFSYSLNVRVQTDENKLVAKLKNSQISIIQPKAYPAISCMKPPALPPVVVGTGPAGLFAGLTLAEAGLAPILLERGEMVENRIKTVNEFWQHGILNPESNVQFGEGGAGTFSDGKLNTNTKDIRNLKVLQEFVAAGAPADILYLAKPHIGTDLLVQVVQRLREKIISLGGEFRFGHKLYGIIKSSDNRLQAIRVCSRQQDYEMPTETLIIATGHSARDTFQMLYESGLPMEQKPFAMGVRIEHPQQLLDQQQYGDFAGHQGLGAADYKLVCHLPNGRTAYTFCMCPGGVVVAAASEIGGIVTNGMSNHLRNATNANSALLINVTTADFPGSHPLAGIELQRQVEQRAFQIAGNSYSAPCQRVGDFLLGIATSQLGAVAPSYLPGVTLGEVSSCLPDFIGESLKIALPLLGNKLPLFRHDDALMTAPETRSSSPVRILRQEDYQSLPGIYPCGEGAGYAGGIMSAAADGIRCGEALINFYND